MTLKEANYEVERLNNDLDKLLKDKALLEVIIDPKSTDYTKILVDGGKHCNSLEIYVLKTELERYKNLDEKIKSVQEKIKNNMDWIDKELKILKKYDKVEQLIVFYKEIDTKEYTWYQISNMVHISVRQCQRIYKIYKRKKDIF